MLKRGEKRKDAGGVLDDGQKTRKSSKNSSHDPSSDGRNFDLNAQEVIPFFKNDIVLNAPAAAPTVENPSPGIPPEFKNQITNLGFSQEILLMQRELTEADVNTDQSYLLIPLENFKKIGFLTEEQKMILNSSANVSVTLFVPFLRKGIINLRKRNPTNYALSDWSRLVENYHLGQGTQIQLWIFKKDSSELGFALILNQDKVKELRKAREIPAKIKNQISRFGGSEEAEAVFVMEKTLNYTDVRSYLAMPKRKIENVFLRDDENQKIPKKSFAVGIDAVLIGPSMVGQEDREFKVKLRKGNLYNMSGAGWIEFVRRYELEVYMIVRLWSFRKPSSSSGSSSSELGFALNFLKNDEDDEAQ